MNHWIQPGSVNADLTPVPATPPLTGQGPAAPITVAAGDGIGPEIMAACLEVLQAAGAQLAIETVEIGERLYRQGHSAGLTDDTWDSLRRTGVFFKAPITTPQGGGYKSLNVTIRKTLGLFANIRPVKAMAPVVPTLHPDMDVIIVRENEEDLYAGIEHQQTADVVQCLKLISRPGCERIAHHAFALARQHGRKRVTCMTKDNIMKLTDGLFRQVFEEVAAEYPDISHDHMIVDIGMARFAKAPSAFDVVLLPNLYGDILSDIAAELGGSVGLAPSVNLGQHCAMFEAIHGSAPDIAGQDIANPSGLLLAGVMMLEHLGQGSVAARVRRAWEQTLRDGIHTADIASASHTRRTVGTRAFAEAVIAHLEPVQTPQPTTVAAPLRLQALPATAARKPERTLVGVDLFLCAHMAPNALAEALQAALEGQALALQMVTNRGVKVWPNGLPETTCTDHWRCRLTTSPEAQPISPGAALEAQRRAIDSGLEVIKTEMLYLIDGRPGYALGQGQ